MALANSEASTQTKAIGSQSPIDGEPAVNNGLSGLACVLDTAVLPSLYPSANGASISLW